MTICPNCNKELSDEAKFCDYCGTQIDHSNAQVVETLFCPNCGAATNADFEFCQNCGTPLNGSTAEAPSEPKVKKKLPIKAILFAAIGVAVIALAAIAGTRFLGKKQSAGKECVLYLKDEEILYSDLKKNSEPLQLTSRLLDDDTISDSDLVNGSYALSQYLYLSENGTFLFFPDKIDGNDDGFNLYYQNISKSDEEAIKIDSDVRSYSVNSSSTVITYLKGSEHNLYQYKIADERKDKIASGVEDFFVSEDGKKIVYINDEDCIYLQQIGKDKEKIASDATVLEYVNSDLSAVYYLKDEALYKKEAGKDKEKIASDVHSVLKVYESGEIYYITCQENEVSLMDYVTDDCKNTDEVMTEPVFPEYVPEPEQPFSYEYDTDEAYIAAYEAYEEAYDAYYQEQQRRQDEYSAACEAYNQKLLRDDMRASLMDWTMEQNQYTLSFYDGKEDTVITDAFAEDWTYYYSAAAEAPVLIYGAYNQSEVSKVKMSELESVYDVESMVRASLYSSSEKYVAVKANASVLEQEKEAVNFRINPSGDTIYYVDDIPDEKDHGTLYRIAISDGKPGKAEVYDSDVYSGFGAFANDSEYLYFKDCKDSKGDLYLSKDRIDYDVGLHSAGFYNASVFHSQGKIVYYVDWSYDNECGTMKIYDGKESVKVADDVHSHIVLPDGRILYLYDYSVSHHNGELYEWNKEKTRKIDDDVQALLPISSSRYRGDFYG